jgi:putative endonuclease
LYIGVTSDLIKRIWEHREAMVEGFTKQYNVKTLVWHEQHATMETAINREKAMKKWRRDWKLKTIEQFNPKLLDLWPQINGDLPAKPRLPRRIEKPLLRNKVPMQAQELIENTEDPVYVSRASLWELAIKVWQGKLHLDLPRFCERIQADGFSWLAIENAHYV